MTHEKQERDVVVFNCSDCQIPVGVTHAYFEDDKIILEGTCKLCRVRTQFTLTAMLQGLLSVRPKKGNGGIR